MEKWRYFPKVSHTGWQGWNLNPGSLTAEPLFNPALGCWLTGCSLWLSFLPVTVVGLR